MCRLLVLFQNVKELKRRLQIMQHGGNTLKTEVIDNIGFGHIRLAIQGLNARFDGPYHTKKLIILYNGEIYNFKELNSKLKCDIQLLEGNYEPELFDGDFSYVRYYKKSKTLEVITDRFGKKQLYFKFDSMGRVTGISSEIKALISKDDEIDEYYLTNIARYGYNFGNQNTFIKSIKKVEHGKRYWINSKGRILNIESIPWDSKLLIPKDYPTDLKSLIELSIKRRLISDVPIGLLYSGGIDSSIILYHLKQLKQKLKIFTIKNGEDLEYAKRYAKELKLKIEIVDIKNSKLDFNEIHKQVELGCDLGSVLPNYNLFNIAKKKGYKVVLTGDASDEVFSKYKRNEFFDYQQNDIFNELIYYHFKRLDQEAMLNTIEYRSPFSADYIIDFGLKLPYEKRKLGKYLKETYKGLIPNYIINRKKEPLKAIHIRKDKEKERLRLLEVFKNKLIKELKNGI